MNLLDIRNDPIFDLMLQTPYESNIYLCSNEADFLFRSNVSDILMEKISPSIDTKLYVFHLINRKRCDLIAIKEEINEDLL